MTRTREKGGESRKSPPRGRFRLPGWTWYAVAAAAAAIGAYWLWTSGLVSDLLSGLSLSAAQTGSTAAGSSGTAPIGVGSLAAAQGGSPAAASQGSSGAASPAQGGASSVPGSSGSALASAQGGGTLPPAPAAPGPAPQPALAQAQSVAAVGSAAALPTPSGTGALSRAQSAGYATPRAYDAALRRGVSIPAQDTGPSQTVQARTPAGQPLFTTAFGSGTSSSPLDFSALASAAIGGDRAAQATLAGQGYKLIPNPQGGSLQPYVVVPA